MNQHKLFSRITTANTEKMKSNQSSRTWYKFNCRAHTVKYAEMGMSAVRFRVCAKGAAAACTQHLYSKRPYITYMDIYIGHTAIS